jgi:hypothetical protein
MQRDLLHANHFHEDMALAHRGAQPDRPPRPFLTALRAIWETLPEAFAAYREYEHMLSRGVPRKAALRKALGVMPDSDRTPS